VIRAAVFDFGETLLSEERAWGAWADWLGATRQELFAALGATIESRRPHANALELLRPGIDWRAAMVEREAAGVARHEQLYDVYPDAAGALARLRAAGIRVAAAGNQPAGAELALAELMEPGELVATSTAWGVSKPDPAFFARIVDELALPAEEVAYVGDRIDFDVLPAAAAGMFTVHLRRGPWGIVHAAWPEATRADATAATLDEAVDHILRAAPAADTTGAA
jgi:HAD superfamily hydrolase (TIGR01549 family)